MGVCAPWVCIGRGVCHSSHPPSHRRSCRPRCHRHRFIKSNVVRHVHATWYAVRSGCQAKRPDYSPSSICRGRVAGICRCSGTGSATFFEQDPVPEEPGPANEESWRNAFIASETRSWPPQDLGSSHVCEIQWGHNNTFPKQEMETQLVSVVLLCTALFVVLLVLLCRRRASQDSPVERGLFRPCIFSVSSRIGKILGDDQNKQCRQRWRWLAASPGWRKELSSHITTKLEANPFWQHLTDDQANRALGLVRTLLDDPKLSALKTRSKTHFNRSSSAASLRCAAGRAETPHLRPSTNVSSDVSDLRAPCAATRIWSCSPTRG
jgi:hypothetical protein